MSKRKEKLRARIGAFIQQYARRSQRGQEPNDRGYSRTMEAKIKRMKPEEFDELLNGDQDETSMPPQSRGTDKMPGEGVPRRGF